MPTVGTIPFAGLGFETQMADAWCDRALERPKHHAGAMSTSQRSQPTKYLIVDASWDLDIERTHSFDERSHHLGPDQSIGAAHDDQSIGRDTDFPCSRRTQPATHIDRHDRTTGGVLGKQ